MNIIAYRHKNPKAFGRIWRKKSKFTDFNFDRYEYKVMDQVFTKDTPEFREALSQYEMMMTLAKD